MGGEEKHDNGCGHHQTGGHQQIFARFHRVDVAGDGLEVFDPDPNCEFQLVVENNVGKEKGIPVANKGDDRRRSQDRPREWQQDLPEDAQVAGTINARRFIQIHRNRHKELTHHKDQERAAAEIGWHDQRQIGIQPLELVEKQIERDQCYFAR